MPDEITPTAAPPSPTPAAPEAPQATLTGEPTGTPPGAAPETPPPAAADLGILDKVAPDDLMRHPRVAGIVGDRLAKAQARWKAEQEEAQRVEAQRRAEQELLDLAENDPVGFSERYLKDTATRRAEEERSGLRGGVRDELARKIGSAIGQLDEMQGMSQDDLGTIQQALMGKSDDEALPAFVQASIDLLAKKRAERRIETEVAKRVDAEKAAWRTQWEAERLGADDAPDMTRGSRRSAFDPTKLDSKEFNDWYEKRVLGR